VARIRITIWEFRNELSCNFGVCVVFVEAVITPFMRAWTVVPLFLNARETFNDLMFPRHPVYIKKLVAINEFGLETPAFFAFRTIDYVDRVRYSLVRVLFLCDHPAKN